jgi:hypothetical protein
MAALRLLHALQPAGPALLLLLPQLLPWQLLQTAQPAQQITEQSIM